jgi:antitoxin component YwqK of YwqJK toxin-antitoxin module
MNKIKLEYICEYYANGQLRYEEYWLNDELHNPNGPAYRGWHENGQLARESYWLNDKLHNPNGPALRGWYENGQLAYEQYYLNGEELTKEQFEAKMNKPSCADRIVVIDGVEYKLTPVEK